MARPKRAPQKEPLKVVSVKLTPATERVLQRLSQDASDRLGWTVSNSATVRALLQCIARQPASWVQAELFPQIEQEIAQGRVWGSKKQI